MKLTILAAIVALGIVTEPAKLAGDPELTSPPSFAAPPQPVVNIPPETPQPDPAVTEELAKAAAILAAAIERDQIAAALAFELGRLSVIVTQRENQR